jgi:hypothetical protein
MVMTADQIANIDRVADVIEALDPARFNMRFWWQGTDGDATSSPQDILHACGTAACIGGWAGAIFYPDDTESASDMWAIGEELFGLDYDDTNNLFMPLGFTHEPFTQAHAVQTLRHLARTGEVNWDHAYADFEVQP